MLKRTRGLWVGALVLVLSGVFCASVFAQKAQGRGEGLTRAPGQLKKAGKTAVPVKETRAMDAKAVGPDAVNKKAESMNEAPNMTSKNDQASSDSGDAATKKKLQDLDTPNPMESTVSMGASRSLGVEAGVKGTGGEPVNPQAGVALPDDPLESSAGEAAMPPDPYESSVGEAAMPPDPLGSVAGQAAMPEEPLEAVKSAGAAQAQKLNAQKRMDAKAMEAQMSGAGR